MKITGLILLQIVFLNNILFSQNKEEQGMFFTRKEYIHHPLPQFDKTKSLLPSPIYDENPLWVETYWKAWEMAFKNFHEPASGSGFVSQFLDPAFNENIFLWDGAFMTMFLNTAHPLVPGISSLDNFYIKQHATGEICREINRTTGKDLNLWQNTEKQPLFSRIGFDTWDERQTTKVIYRGRKVPEPNPELTLDALNHPILAWAEMESYKWTGDKERLKSVRLPLIKYYEALKKYLRQGNGLYMTDWASMDNSPRNLCLNRGGTAIDISSEMVLFARNLAEIDAILGLVSDSKIYKIEADSLSSIINSKMWDEKKKFYFDLTIDESKCPVKTIAGFWPLISKTATPEKAEILVDQLKNPQTFGRLHPVPTIAADERGYSPSGGYWSGAVWTMTNTMIIKGLEEFHFDELARDIALKHLNAIALVYKETGTFWENYAPDSIKEGRHPNGAPVVKDIVGWGALAPVLYFIEYGIGLKPDASKNVLVWNFKSIRRCGMENFRFNGHVTSLIASPDNKGFKIKVNSDGFYTLIIKHNGSLNRKEIKPGENSFAIN